MPTINKTLPDATTWVGTTGATWTSHGSSMTVERFMPTFPTIAVECAFGDDPFTASPTWTDITDYVVGPSWVQHGKQHELARIEAGAASFVLYSSDDRFNPENTAGAYYPDLKPMVQIRVQVTDPLTSTVYTVWRGFVTGWPQTWTLNGKLSRVPIRCVDVLGLFARIPITDWETAVNADTPLAFWRFGTGATLTDETGNHDGTANGPTDGTISSDLAIAGTDTDGSVDRGKTFDGTNDFIDGFADNASLRLAGDMSIELWVKPDSTQSGSIGIICTMQIGTGPPSEYAYEISYSKSGSGNIQFSQFDGIQASSGASVAPLPSGSVNDEWHHYVAVRTGRRLDWYVDGVLAQSKFLAASLPGSDSAMLLRMGYADNSGTKWKYFKGAASEIAIYDKALTPGRILAHYNARFMFGGASVVESVITNLANLIGWPSAMSTTAGASSSTAALPSVAIDESLLSLLRRITESQEYPIFVDREGKWVMMTRDYQPISKNTPDFTIGDGAAEFSYVDLNVPNDYTPIRNLWRVTPIGGVVEEASDATSDSSFATRDKQISNALIAENVSPTDTTGSQTLALARAQSGLAKSKDAIFRIEKVTINPMSDADYWQHILPLDLTDRIKINRTPPGGSIQTHEAYVEHIRHDFTVSKKWVTTLRLSPASLQDQWILGDSVMSLLGETTKLGW